MFHLSFSIELHYSFEHPLILADIRKKFKTNSNTCTLNCRQFDSFGMYVLVILQFSKNEFACCLISHDNAEVLMRSLEIIKVDC